MTFDKSGFSFTLFLSVFFLCALVQGSQARVTSVCLESGQAVAVKSESFRTFDAVTQGIAAADVFLNAERSLDTDLGFVFPANQFEQIVALINSSRIDADESETTYIGLAMNGVESFRFGALMFQASIDTFSDDGYSDLRALVTKILEAAEGQDGNELYIVVQPSPSLLKFIDTSTLEKHKVISFSSSEVHESTERAVANLEALSNASFGKVMCSSE